MQNHILAADPLLLFTYKIDLDCRRNLEPELARSHCRRHIRRADSRGKRPERAIRAGMRIRADRKLSGYNQSLLRNQCMLNAHLANIKIIFESLLGGKIPAHLRAFGRSDILVRHKMVHDKHDLVLIKHHLLLHFFHFTDRDRRRNIISMHQVHLSHDELTCLHLIQSRMLCQNLLAHCHCHTALPYFNPLNILYYLNASAASHS